MIDTLSPEWLAAVEAASRQIAWRAALVDFDGNEVADLPNIQATISFSGEVAEQWSGSLTQTDPDLVPVDPEDYLDPRSGLRVRFFWSCGDMEMVVATLTPEDQSANDDQITDHQVSLRDALTKPTRAGYGSQVVSVGGGTVGDALLQIFGAIAPNVPVVAAPSTVRMPPVYELGENPVRDDWTDIAAMEGWVVRTDRYGTIVCGPPQYGTLPTLLWAEGEDCPVQKLGRQMQYSSIINQVVVRSTAQDIPAPIVGVVRNDDPTDPNSTVSYGVQELKIDSDAVTTIRAAENMARAHFEQSRRPTELLTFSCPQRPDLDYRQVINLESRNVGVSGNYRLAGWSAETGVNPMTVTMMRQDMRE